MYRQSVAYVTRQADMAHKPQQAGRLARNGAQDPIGPLSPVVILPT